MSNENIKIVRNYFDAIASGDLAKLPELLSETLVWHQPGSSDLSGTYNSRDAVFGLLGKFMERSQGTFKFDSIGNILGNGNHVAVTLQFSATAAGKAMSMAGIDVLRIENGKIQEVWLFSDDQAAEDAFWSVG
ncbi:nuclear transport factor 2 family protein [Altererythrobacter sp. Root672]|uniref:nuclear transport factor 2 family protein n=1 Tax=Altererythrobacter sp. Root672 TaxID=1736584 RepID=UPI0006FAA56B|nr:nuclear transport factor 2 family protein [Altererythrobacter sp. Root672]KRA82904.1 ketosteroid isomerase [Altererythrobacter sp. Root672]